MEENIVVDYRLITTDADLLEVCQRAATCDLVAIDTEFVRTRTLYPQLGLVQLFDGQHVSLIDPLAMSDLAPLRDLLVNPAITKVLHACGEDLEVFQHYLGVMPTPMLDTQIMAAFLGHRISTGFAALVAEYQGVELDKGESRTDWLARPLTEKQCHYAAADVYYLLPMFKTLLEKVQQSGHMGAVQAECLQAVWRRSQITQPDLAYRDISNAWQLYPRQLACLRLLAKWRIEEAQRRDLALNFVVKELSLWKVARYLPQTMSDLNHLELENPAIRFHGRTMLQMVDQAKKLPESECPAALSRLVDNPEYKATLKEIKAFIGTLETETGLSSELLASRRQIHQLLSFAWKSAEHVDSAKSDQDLPELLSGWRGELMGERLQKLLSKSA